MISTIQLALVSKSVFLYFKNANDVCFFVSTHVETARTHAVCVSLSFTYNVNQQGVLRLQNDPKRTIYATDKPFPGSPSRGRRLV
jgi:hypothetical protein